MTLKDMEEKIIADGIVVGFCTDRKLRIDVLSTIGSPESPIHNAHELDEYLLRVAKETGVVIDVSEGEHIDFKNKI